MESAVRIERTNLLITLKLYHEWQYLPPDHRRRLEHPGGRVGERHDPVAIHHAVLPYRIPAIRLHQAERLDAGRERHRLRHPARPPRQKRSSQSRKPTSVVA